MKDTNIHQAANIAVSTPTPRKYDRLHKRQGNLMLKHLAALLLLSVATFAPMPAVAQAVCDGALTWTGIAPDCLSGGENYRILFVTSGTRDATSADITEYNTFVQAQALDTTIDPSPLTGITFNALASTAAVGARDNTNTPATSTGEKIFYYLGRKVADDYADLYDGNWDTTEPRNQNGATFGANPTVWTGSFNSGEANSSFGLGSGAPLVAVPNNAVQVFFITTSQTGNGTSRNLYALSAVLTGPAVVDDATLSALTISDGILDPAFDPATTTYTVAVAGNVASVTVTPTATQNNAATITVNTAAVTSGSASSAIDLPTPGTPVTVTIEVTAADGATTETYTLMVTRATVPNTTPTAMAVIPVNAQSGRTDVYTGTVATLDGSGSSDADVGDSIAAYAWTQTGATAASNPVTLDFTTPAMPTFMAPVVTAATDLEFSLTVTDTFGVESATPATVTITVNLRPRLVMSTEPASVNEGSGTIAIRFTVDPNGGPSPNRGSFHRIRPTLGLEGATSAADFDFSVSFSFIPGGPTDYQGSFPQNDFDTNLSPGGNAGSINVGIVDDTLAEITAGCAAGTTPIPATTDNCITLLHTNAGGSGNDGTVGGQGGDLFLPTEPLVLAIADNDPTFSTATIDDQTYIVGVDIGSVTLPTATGGNGALTYTLAPLPDGLTLSDNVLSGIPETMQASTTHTYTVTDSDSNTNTIDFMITINANTAPTAMAVIPVNAESGRADVYTGTVATLDGSGSSDPDAGDSIAAYAWTQTEPTATSHPVTLSDASVAMPTFMAPAVTAATDLEFSLTVTDTFGAASAPATATITVNLRPRLVMSTEPASVNEGSGTIAIRFTVDPNGGPSPNRGSFHRIRPTLGLEGATSAADFDFSVSFSFIPGGPTDYQGSFPQNDFDTNLSPGGDAGSINVGIVDDTLAEITAGCAAGTTPIPATTDNCITLLHTNAGGSGNDGTVGGQGGDLFLPTEPLVLAIADNDPTFSTTTIAAQTYIVGVGIGSVTLPTATGGNGALTYTLAPLPDGLTLSDNVLSGIPETMQDSTTHTYTVTDSGSNTDTIEFMITINANTAPTAMAVIPVNAQSGRADVYTGTVATLDGSGSSDPDSGDSIDAYAWTQTEPTATSHPVTLDFTTPAMPTFMAPAVTAATELEFSLTVTDTFGVESAPATATMTVNLRPRLVISTDPASVNEGSGTITIVYTVDPNGGPTPNRGTGGENIIRPILSFEGVTAVADFDFSGGFIPGGPTGYDYQGEFGQNAFLINHSPGDRATGNFLTIEDDTLAETTVGCVAGTTPIPATADNCIRISHTSGFADTNVGAVGNPGGDLFLLTEPFVLAIADNDPTFSTTTIAAQTYTVGVDITPVTLPTATGGNPPLAYTISALPTGLTLSDNVLSGIPETMQASTTHTYTVTDSDSNTNTIDFMITINANTITGVAIGAVTEDDNSAATDTGTLTVTGGFIPQTGTTDRAGGLGTYGNFTLDATSGDWTYTLNNDPATTQGAATHALAAGDTPTDVFTAVSATDSGVTRNVIITVTGANDAPTANAGPDQPAVISGATVTLDGSGSSDPDTGDTIDTYTWMQTGGTTVTLSDNNIAMPTFTAPTVTTATTMTFTLVVNDGTADSPADTVDIIVNANNVPDFASETIADQTYTEGVDIGSVTLPTATGGDGALSYALTPMLPDGLTFTAADRTLTGTPAASTMQAAITYTYTVSDSDANVAATDTGVLSFTIAIGVNTAPTAMVVIPVNAQSGRADVYTATVATLDGSGSSDSDAGDSIDAYAWTQTEPTATSHPVTLDFTTPAMPTFMAPAVTAATDLEFSLTVTDTFGVESAPATATITVNLRPRLVISTEPASVNEGSGTIAINYTVDPNGGPTPNLGGTSSKIRTTLDFEGATSADDFNLFGWVPGGTTDYQFEFTSSFGANLMPGSDVSSAPLGITDDALAETTTGCTAGTTIPGTTDNCITIFHINALGTTPGLVDGPGGNLFLPAEPLVVAIADNDPIFSTTTIDAQTYTVGVGIGSVTLPTAIGGNPPLAYTISALPDGLSLSDNVLSGIPETMQAVTTHTYTVTDGGGSNTDTIDFTITIDANTITGVAVGAVTEDDNSAATATGTLTLASEDFIAQDGTTDRAGGLGAYGSFVLDATSGEWTYTLDNDRAATNALAAGAIVTDVFTAVSTPTTTVRRDVIITVTGANDAPTANAGPDQPDVISGATVTLDGSGSSDPDTGDTIDTYTWMPPGGTPSVTLTGAATAMPTFTAPTVTTATTLSFTLVVSDGTDDSPADTVDIIVNANTVPDFASETIADQTYTEGVDIGSVTLPTATGGDGALSYALTPMLPDGLTFTAADRTLTGTPAAGTMQAATTYTYTVGDADTNIDPADTDTLTFTITVNAAGVNPAGVTVDPMTLSVPEADGTGTYTVVLDTEPTGDVTITPVSGDTMAATVSGALTFTTTDWNTAQTVTVTGVDDTTDNPGDARTVTVTHAPTGADTTYNLVVIDSVTVTVEDDDVAAGVTVDPTSVTVPEASGTNTYTVVLDTQPTGDVTITPVSGDTMAATVSSALTFTTTDWNTAQTVTVTGVNDNDDNPGNARTVTVTHAPTGADSVYNSVSIDSVTVTVTDDDGPSALLEAVSPTTLGERRLNSSTNRATVRVTLMDTVYVGTAELTGADFMLTDTVDGEVTVESAVTRDSATVATLTLGHSGGISNDGTVSVTVLASAHIGSGDLPAVSLPIDATAPTVSSVAFSTTGPYGLGADIEVTITFSEDVFVEETTPNALLDNIGTRNAVATPYNRGDGSNTLVFRYTVVLDDTNANGVNIRRAVLESGGGIIRDAAGNDVVRDPSNSQIIGGTDQRIDTSIIAPPSITIAADTSPVTEGTAAEFTLTASAPAPVGGLTVTVSVSQTGTFIEGPPPTTVTIAAAATTAALTVATTDDNIVEAAGSVTATVTAGAGYTVGSGNTASVTVDDNDAGTAPVLQTATVNRNMLALGYDTALDSTSTPAGADYTLMVDAGPLPTVSTVVITSSTATLTLSESIIGNQTVTLDYTPGSNPLRDLASNNAVLLDDQAVVNTTRPFITDVVISSDPGADETYAIGEDIEVTVTFSEAVGVTGTPEITIPGITVGNANADFVSGSGTTALVFRHTVAEGVLVSDGIGISNLNVQGGEFITASIDSTRPADRTFTALPPQSGHKIDGVRPALSSATVDDVTLTLAYAEALDGASTPANGDYVVTVDTAPVTVNDVSISGMAVTLTLATAVPSGQMVTLDYTPGTNPVQDTAGNDAVMLDDQTVGAGVLPSISITAVSPSVTEGAVATFTLTATPAPAANLTVMVTVTEAGTFISGAAPTTVTIPSSGSVTLTVPTTDDSTDEANGTITATVTAGSGYTVGSPLTASVTVEDNDGTPDPAITIAAVSSSVTEGAAATFTLTATPAPAANLTVMVTVTETGTFISGAAPTTVTIPSSGSVTLTVPTTDDSTDEANGTITATVTAGTGYTVGSPPTASVTVEDNDGAPDPAITIAAVSSSVTEGAAATFTLTATPAPAANLTVTVTVTETGTFINGAAPTTVTIPSSGSVTLTVPTTDDATDEANGTITATVTAGSGYTVGSPLTASVTVEDNDAAPVTPDPEQIDPEQTEQLHEEIAPQAVQAIAGNVVASVGARIETAIQGAPPTGGVRLDGQGIEGDGKAVLLGFLDKAPEYTRSIKEGTLDWKRMLANSSFALNAAGGHGIGGAISLWGSGHYTEFDGDDNNLDWDGDSYGFQIGADTRWNNNLLTGLSVSWSEGEVEYIQGSGDSREEGDYTLTLVGIHPYLGWSNDSGSLSLWGSVGYADGEVEIEPDGGSRRTHDTTLVSVAGGFKHRLTGFLNVKGDFSAIETDIDESVDVTNDRDLTVDSQRLRLLLEGYHQNQLGGGRTLTQSAEVGYRVDGGDSDADTNGAELALGFDYHNPAAGLTLAGKGRALVGNSDYREWSVSGLIRLQPQAYGQGLTFTLEPGYGGTASEAGELWNRNRAYTPIERNEYGAQMKAHLSYGLNGFVTPYTEVTSGESLRRFRMGVKWQLGEALDLDLFGEQYEADESDNSLQLEGKLEF